MGRVLTRPAETAEVLQLWLQSPHGTVFTHPEVVRRMMNECHWWIVFKGDEPVMAWPVHIDNHGLVAIPRFSYYFGPIWSQTACERSPTNALAHRLETYNHAISELWSVYGSIAAELHPDLLDVRAFDWWNYGRTSQPRFKISPRYTAQLCELDRISGDELFKGLRELRRRELRRFERDLSFSIEVVTCAEKDLSSSLVRLYLDVIPHDHGQDSVVIGDTILGLVDLVGAGWGFILLVRDLNSNAIACATLTLEAKGVANLVLNLTSPSYRRIGVAAASIYETVLEAKRRGASVFDFNGANSPNRGDDKHSYGAREALYFRLEM